MVQKRLVISKKDIVSAVSKLHTDSDIIMYLQSKHNNNAPIEKKERFIILTIFFTEYIRKRTARSNWFSDQAMIVEMSKKLLSANNWSSHIVVTPRELGEWFDEELRKIINLFKASA